MRTSPTPKPDSSVSISSLPSKVQSRITALVDQKLDLEDTISNLELLKRSILSELLDISTQHSLPKVQGDGWRLTEPQVRTARTLSEMKLVEHGVSLKVIQECTEEKMSRPFVKVERVKERRDNQP